MDAARILAAAQRTHTRVGNLLTISDGGEAVQKVGAHSATEFADAEKVEVVTYKRGSRMAAKHALSRTLSLERVGGKPWPVTAIS
jgi:hypothetical protein